MEHMVTPCAERKGGRGDGFEVVHTFNANTFKVETNRILLILGQPDLYSKFGAI